MGHRDETTVLKFGAERASGTDVYNNTGEPTRPLPRPHFLRELFKEAAPRCMAVGGKGFATAPARSDGQASLGGGIEGGSLEAMAMTGGRPGFVSVG